MQHKPLIVGNWKLNPSKEKDAIALVSGIQKGIKKLDAAIAIAPPFIYLAAVKKKLGKSNVALAAQDVSSEIMGPFTGEVSAMQLKDSGVSHVIIGHSERRAMGESDALVNQKITQALKNNIVPIVCIGEKERDESGKFFSFVENQIRAICGVLSATQIKKVIIAYEPIWAIGTGKTATEDDVKEMQLFILTVLTKLYDKATAKKVQLLYGGSVKPQNAVSLHKHGGMDGFLVGGASLKANDFVEIIKATT